MIGDKPDIPWSDGWDVLIPWEVDLAMRQRERDELLKAMDSSRGYGPSIAGATNVQGGPSISGSSVPTATATATSTGGA